MKQSHTQKEVGPWARQKLGVLREYLEFYTTVLKNKNFNLVYIDAFAGSRKFKVRGTEAAGQNTFDFLPDGLNLTTSRNSYQHYLFEKDFNSNASKTCSEYMEDKNTYIRGSPYCALDITKSRGFDCHYFFEKDPKRVDDLRKLKKEFPSKNIYVKEGDANILIQDLIQGQKLFQREHVRGVAFLDPYGAHLEWATVETLAKTEKMEIIINFPIDMAINRLIPISKKMEENLIRQLNLYFGNEDWYRIAYRKSRDLFGCEIFQKQDGVPIRLLELYIKNLKKMYTYVASPRLIKNTRRLPLYYLIWAGPNDLGIKGAESILSNKHIKLQWW